MLYFGIISTFYAVDRTLALNGCWGRYEGLYSILYYLLGRYFDQVIPKEYGLTQPWYFLFTKAYWRGEMVQPKHTPIDHSKDER